MNPADDKPSLLDAFTKPSLNAGLVALVAVGGPLVAAVTIVAFGPRERDLAALLMEVVSIGWFGPLIVLASIGVTNYYTNKRISRDHLVRARMSSLALGVVASRARYYIQTGHVDPVAAAMHDTAAYMFGPCQVDLHLSWTRASLGWYTLDGVAEKFPAPPRSIYEYASVKPEGDT